LFTRWPNCKDRCAKNKYKYKYKSRREIGSSREHSGVFHLEPGNTVTVSERVVRPPLKVMGEEREFCWYRSLQFRPPRPFSPTVRLPCKQLSDQPTDAAWIHQTLTGTMIHPPASTSPTTMSGSGTEASTSATSLMPLRVFPELSELPELPKMSPWYAYIRSGSNHARHPQWCRCSEKDLQMM
jgi:hypothetical protein